MYNTFRTVRYFVAPVYKNINKRNITCKSQLNITNSSKKNSLCSYSVHQNNILFTNIKSSYEIVPKNIRQELYIDTLQTVSPSIVLSTGPAGSAKSFLAVAVGIERLIKKDFKRIVITRPTVSVDEDVGYLPGAVDKKMEPWMQPLYDTFYKYFSVSDVKYMIGNKIIDICPIAYLRGRTFEDSYIIIDEAQNCTVNQMLMILTRIGANSKMVITGDLSQHDRGFEINGLGDFLRRKNMHQLRNNIEFVDIAHIKFTENDIVRHPVIKDIMTLYNDK
jgi:phosphate starvation-inducible PhoH-like protein